MKKICTEVRDNYQLYEQLLLGKKITQGKDFCLTCLKPSSTRWKVDALPVEHLFDDQQSGTIHTEISIHEKTKFKFLLFNNGLMRSPLVNYDSQGLAHRNDRHVPFAEQKIDTPHFNRYNKDGRRYAYKTEALNNPQTAEELKEINNCLIHFYNEFNIHHTPAGYPSVLMFQESQQELFPKAINDDPLAHVTKF